MYFMAENILEISSTYSNLLKRIGKAFLHKELFEKFNFFTENFDFLRPGSNKQNYLFYMPLWDKIKEPVPTEAEEIILSIDECVIDVDPQRYILSAMHFFTEYPIIDWVETFYEKFAVENVKVELYYKDAQRNMLGYWRNGEHTTYTNNRSWHMEDLTKHNVDDMLIDAFGLIYTVEDAEI